MILLTRRHKIQTKGAIVCQRLTVRGSVTSRCSWTFAMDSSSESEFNLHLASDLEISDEDEENVIESENEDSEWCV